MECPRRERSFKQRSALMVNANTLESSPNTRDAAMAYDEAIVTNHLPWKKLNFPDGLPIEDQSDDDDGYLM